MSMTGLDESKDASKSPQAQLEAVPLWDLRRELTIPSWFVMVPLNQHMKPVERAR